jgi:hypothetical protein
MRARSEPGVEEHPGATPRGVTGLGSPCKIPAPALPTPSESETTMARKSRTAVLKRQREAKKAEKAAMKREKRETRETRESEGGDRVATSEDLEGYGFVPGQDDDDEHSR